MKPKVFIGSSVEGLSVAYSIQQNLAYDADVTVWTQGVFELSKTSIESLVDFLDKSDFGIFVFNQDDIIKIRHKEENIVRDNILFEFGLFIGKLSRERVFFIIPERTTLHIPTDLIGVTPGTYDPNRDDKSLLAATGPVCHQIRMQMAKLGVIHIVEETTAKAPEEKATLKDEESKWVDLFFDRQYKEAKTILEKMLVNEKIPEKKMHNIVWLGYCDFKLDEIKGIRIFEELLKENRQNKTIHEYIAKIYYWENYFDKAIAILENAIPKFSNDSILSKTLSDCYKKTDGIGKALNYLMTLSPDTNLAIAEEIYNIYCDQKDYSKAREIVHKIYLNFPNNEMIRFYYAKVALELDQNEVALYFLTSLANEFPDRYIYWGYLSNAYVKLDLYDRAMTASKKANEVANEKEEWLIANIGNILKNKGFYSEGIKYLEAALKLDNNSQYSHDRLATSIKYKNEEINKANTHFEEGRKQLRQYKVNEELIVN